MRNQLTVLLLALCTGGIAAAGSEQIAGGTFEGTLAVEEIDDPFVPALRVTEELLFLQSGGETWVVPEGAVVDGRSMPKMFVDFFGEPFESAFVKSAVIYDYAAKAKARRWHDAQRMFLQASLAEGVEVPEAKVMYALLQATGTRWAVRWMSGCYGRCHAPDAELEWRPRVDDAKVSALVTWVRRQSPTLGTIDEHVDDVIVEAGPHVIGPAKQDAGASDQMIFQDDE